MSKERLTQRQETFCLKYFELGNASEAALIAGYSPKTAPFIGSENLKKPQISQRINALRKVAQDASIADVVERKQILTEIVRARLPDYTTCGPDRDLIDVGPESPNTAALREVTTHTDYDKDGAGVAVVTKVKLHSNIQAIAELNKMEGEYAPAKVALTDAEGRDVLGGLLSKLRGYDQAPQITEGDGE